MNPASKGVETIRAVKVQISSTHLPHWFSLFEMLRPEPPRSDAVVDRRPPAISDYELICPIGSGAYGEVWLARGVTGLLRAVKIVRRDRFSAAEPFEREFHGLKEFAAISLVASNQLALLHVGQNLEAGFFYYVMELADDIDTGRNIDIQRYTPCTLSALQRKKGRLATTEAIAIGVELARGLASLHSHGLIHRDIKPANIIFVGGTPKLADIGLVTAAELGQSIIGTEGFIAPEGPGTPAADVYSAGKVLYELNTGLDRKAFPALPSDANGAIKHRQFLDLNEVVLRACATDASRRYQTAEALLRDLLALQAGRGLFAKRVARWLSPVLFRVVAALMILAIAAAGAWLWPQFSPSRTHLADGGISPRSIAVLPFANLSPDAKYPFFADGIHDDVILRLAKIRDLKVISRTSVVAYKEGARNLKEIAADLGVAYILEGTVQRQDSLVRISVRLVDARTDNPVWAQDYEEKLTDAFAIQSALSQQIAGVLQAKLTESERRLITHRPTRDPSAYDLYLQARDLYQQLGFYGSKEKYDQVIKLCQDAIARDPNFAEAYVQLSLTHSSLYRFSDDDPSPMQLSQASWAAAMAARLAPGMPEARLARGVIHYLGDRDWPSALREFRAAEADLPNDEQLQWWMGNVLRRLGRWDEAIRYFISSSALNPRAPAAAITAVQSMRYLRRFTAARDLAQAKLQRFPNDRWLQTEFAKCQLEIDGDRAGFIRRLENRAAGDNPKISTILERNYESAYRRADWQEAARVLEDKRLTGLGDLPNYIETPVALHRALVAYLAQPSEAMRLEQRPEAIRAHAKDALDEYANGNWNNRQKPWVSIGRARAHALRGETDNALSHAAAAWNAVADTDAIDAAIMLSRVCEVHLILGQTEVALDKLRQMMRRPNDWGPQAFRVDPLWQRLMSDHRAEEILQSAKPL